MEALKTPKRSKNTTTISSSRATRSSPRKHPLVERPEPPEPLELRELQLERLLSELQAEKGKLQQEVIVLEKSQTNINELQDRLTKAEALARDIEEDKAIIRQLRSQLNDRDRTITTKEEESAKNQEIVQRLQAELKAERNAKTQDATRLRNEIDKIQKELLEAKEKHVGLEVGRDLLRKQLRDAKSDNNHFSRVMKQMEIDMEQKKAQELADKVNSFEMRLKEAEERSRNLEAEKKGAEDSLNEKLRNVVRQAEERAKAQDQNIRDLQDIIRHQPAVNNRPDSAMSARVLALDFTPQSTHTRDASPQDINVTSQADFPNSNPPLDSPEEAEADVSMADFTAKQVPLGSSPVLSHNSELDNNATKTFDYAKPIQSTPHSANDVPSNREEEVEGQPSSSPTPDNETQQPCSPCPEAVASNHMDCGAKARDHNQGNQNKTYTLEQEAAVTRVRRCLPTAFYDILGLEQVKATDAETKKAYRKLSILTHPDKNGHEHADEAFKMVSGAFGVLSDSDKKAKYDRRFGRRGAPPFSERGGNYEWGNEEINPEQMFNMSPEEMFDMFCKMGGFGPYGSSSSSANPASPPGGIQWATVDACCKTNNSAELSSPAAVRLTHDESLNSTQPPASLSTDCRGTETCTVPNEESAVQTVSPPKSSPSCANARKSDSGSSSNPPLHDSSEKAEYSGDVLMTDPSLMESLSGSMKEGGHSNMISTELQNSSQIILPGDGAPTESAPDLRVTCDESLDPTRPNCDGKETCPPLPNEPSAVPTSLSKEQSAGPAVSSPKPSSSRADNSDAQKDSAARTVSLLEKPSKNVASLKSSSKRQRSDGESSLPPGNGERSVEEPDGGAFKNSRDGHSPMVENDFAKNEGGMKNPGRKAKQTVPQPADGSDAPTTRKSKKAKKAADHTLATQAKTIQETYAEQSRGHIHLRFHDQPERKTSAGSTKRHKKLSLQFCSRYRRECESLGHMIPLDSLGDISQLCHPTEDSDFSPNIIRLVSRCELAKLSPADMEELTRLLQEIADHKNIPPLDDNELIQRLLGDIHRSSSKYDSELSIAHMLRGKMQLAKDEKHFLIILYYSVLAVYKYRTREKGEDKFYKTMKHEFGEFSNYENQMIDVVLCLHWLCKEKDVAQAWRGRILLLPIYIFRAGGGKLRTYLGALKRPMTYGMLRLLLSDPYFMFHHLPSDSTNTLGQKTLLSEVQDLRSGQRPEVVALALGYIVTSTPSRLRLSASGVSNPPQDRPENTESTLDSHWAPVNPTTLRRSLPDGPVSEDAVQTVTPPRSAQTVKQQGTKRKWDSEMMMQQSKRQRWGLFGQYIIPAAYLRSSQLDADVKSFASYLDDSDEYILIQGHKPWAPSAEFYSKSILRLQSSEWFDDEHINAVSSLVEVPADCRTFLLSSFIYDHLKKGEFSAVDSWVEGLPKDHTRWAWGICENNHLVVVVILWEGETVRIFYYDPWEEQRPNPARRIDTLEWVAKWVTYLCGVDNEESICTGILKGPKQERNDTTSCGPLACWALGVLKQGREVIEGSILLQGEVVNPLEVRMQLYRRLQATPRTRRTADVGDETGPDSDLEEISAEEASKGKEKMGSRSAKGPPVGELNIPGRNTARNNSMSNEQTPRDAPVGETEDFSQSDDAASTTGSPPWMPDPNSPSFRKGDAQAYMPEAESARKGKSVPPTVRKVNLVDEDVNAQTTSSSARSLSRVTTRETGSSAIGTFDDTLTAAGGAVPSTSTRLDIPNEALNRDTKHYSLSESPLPEQGIGPGKSFTETTGEGTGISSNAGDIYAVPDDTIESVQKSQKRKRYHPNIYPKKQQRLEGDDDVATSMPRNAPDTAPSSLGNKHSSVPNRTSAKKSEATIAEPRILASTPSVQLADESIRHCTATEPLWEQQALNSGIESERATSEHPNLSHVMGASSSCEGLLDRGQPSMDMKGEKDVAATNVLTALPGSASSQTPTYPSAGETVAEHIKGVPESTNDQVETEAASVTALAEFDLEYFFSTAQPSVPELSQGEESGRIHEALPPEFDLFFTEFADAHILLGTSAFQNPYNNDIIGSLETESPTPNLAEDRFPDLENQLGGFFNPVGDQFTDLSYRAQDELLDLVNIEEGTGYEFVENACSSNN